MPLKDNLSQQLKRCRALRDQSIVEFSSSLGIAKSTLQEFEAGRGNPTLGTIDLMEQNLGVEEGSLLSSAGDLTIPTPLLAAVPVLAKLPLEKRRQACSLLLKLASLCDGEGGDDP